MKVTKITEGYVAQVFDTDTQRWIRQSFVAGTNVTYENEQGEPLDSDVLDVSGVGPYLPFDMTQPDENQ